MVYCSALNCQNATSGVYKNSAVTFYGFPLQNKPLLKQWIHNMGRDMGTPSKYQRLCSKHFEDNSFVIDPLKIRKNRRLLKEAVPKKFILDDNGNWLVGTPQSFCGGRSAKTRKRIRNPEHSRVPEIFDNAAAREGKGSEDWQKEFYKKLIKGNYESSGMLGKDCPVPKSSTQAREALHVKEKREIPARLSAGSGGTVVESKLQSHTKHVENTELRRSFSGGSQDSSHQISDKGVTSGSHQNLAADQANPTGNRKDNSLEEEEPDKFGEILLHQQPHTRERLYLCAECQKTFKFKIGLLKHKQIHTKNNWGSSYICTDCGNNFGCYGDLVHHQRTQMGERPYKCTECETSYVEKPRFTDRLQTPNVYV